VRNVPEEMKREVYREYGITSHGPGDYEIDHLISLELGGSNSIKNLWPESHRTSPWNAQVEDRLEDKLHELVCSGQLDLKTAQQAIASNWIEAYKKYVSPNPPIPESMSNRAPEAADTAGQVWVNTRSGKYWEPGSRFYGKTKSGPIHVRRRSTPERLLASEWYWRMTMAVSFAGDACPSGNFALLERTHIPNKQCLSTLKSMKSEVLRIWCIRPRHLKIQ
jgi:hypothetical protein